MNPWPKSVPDYKWPRAMLALHRAPARWLAAGAFHLAYLAGRCVSFLQPNRPAVLVIRTDGIGEAVLAEPMTESLARRYADHAFHLWAPPATCELFRAVPYCDKRTPIPRGGREGNLAVLLQRSWRVNLGYRLGRWNFSAAIYLAGSPEPLGNWLFSSARAKERWYAPGNTENQFAAQRAATSRRASTLMGFPQSSQTPLHELTRNAILARRWDANISRHQPTIHLDDAAFQSAAKQAHTWRQIGNWLGASAVVGVIPAPSAALKKYPARGWGEALRSLWFNHRIVCALLAGEPDRGDVNELESELGQIPRLRMARSLDLPAMAALIGSLDGILSVDNGLAHLAMAQDIPTVVLASGSHPGRFFPWPAIENGKLSRGVTLNYAMPCAGCGGRCHLNEPECVTRIEPEQIVIAIMGLLGRRRDFGFTPLPPLRVAG